MVSIGGPKPNNDATAIDPSIAISQMAGNTASRKRFIETTLALAENYKFDGVELAWIYPKTKLDMTNLHNLFREWKIAADLHNFPNGRKLLLSAAVYCYPSIPNAPNEEVRYTGELDTCIDIFNIIFYNYSPVTSYHSRFGPIRPSHNYNTQDALQEWRNVRISLTKLVMGIPLYGGKWIMADDVNEVTDGAQAVEYKGRVAYRDIPDPETGGTYDDVAWCTSKVERDANGNPFWYGYEDTKSVSKKIDLNVLFERAWKTGSAASAVAL
uniref:GH18 domain-containing protein n=1 Tax=Cannabis sativa TaxID=3483 RepID=A0A803QAA3_CANSA